MDLPPNSSSPPPLEVDLEASEGMVQARFKAVLDDAEEGKMPSFSSSDPLEVELKALQRKVARIKAVIKDAEEGKMPPSSSLPPSEAELEVSQSIVARIKAILNDADSEEGEMPSSSSSPPLGVDLKALQRMTIRNEAVFNDAEKKETTSSSPFLPQEQEVDHEDLQRMAAQIEALLNDAEDRVVRDASVRFWLKDIKDVAYEVDDLLDEYEYELLRAKVEAGIHSAEPTASLSHEQMHSEVSHVITTTTTTPCLDASFWSKAAGVTRKVQGKLEEISKCADLHLRLAGHGQRNPGNTKERPPDGSLVDGRATIGRQDELDKVKGMLLSEECRNSDLFVIPVVGIGGVGKTTLAQLVYNDSDVCNIFRLRGWVSVYSSFDLIQLTRKVLEVFTKVDQRLTELSVLQVKLMDEIKGRRFLLILDDVWDENPGLCDRLLSPLKHGKLGSAIIVTTRSQTVAANMAPTHVHHQVDCLSEADCWELLKQNAFRGQDADENSYPELVEIGKQIARKCKGLPLAAKSLGRLVRHSGYDVETWWEVLKSNVWDVDDEIIPALMVSYVHLSGHLKQCFLYASIFPKDFHFNKDDLVRLWMAQGYIRQITNRELEAVGNSYFDELLSMSFFQSNPVDPSCFVMHHLIHDLAQYIWNGEHVMLDVEKGGRLRVPEARHLSLKGSRHGPSLSDLHYLAPEAVRTVVDRTQLLDRSHVELEFITKRFLNLRVLNLSGGGLRWLPEAIGNLKHLRYLNLANNQISTLPVSVGKLYHLQTLILGSSADTELPTSLTNLVSLRCLEVGWRTQLPRGIGRLTSLRACNVLNVGKVCNEDCAGLEELGDLMHLRGCLKINNLENIVNAEKAKEANLKSKKISSLDLNWNPWYHSITERSRRGDLLPVTEHYSPDLQKEVLEGLCPYGDLKQLKISDYGGSIFPKWVGDPRFSQLAEINIKCPKLIALPSFGRLRSLRCLTIREGHAVQVVDSEFRGRDAVGFPALEELVFEDMVNWREWGGAVMTGDFPRLRRLELEHCPQLMWRVPLHHLSALEELSLSSCKELTFDATQSPPFSFSWTHTSSSAFTSLLIQSPIRSGKCLPAHPSSSAFTSLLTQSPIKGRRLPSNSSHEEGQQQLRPPPNLRDLFIDDDCPLLVEWCETDAGKRWLSAIPGAKPLKLPDGGTLVSSGDEIVHLVKLIELKTKRSRSAPLSGPLQGFY